MDRNDPSRPRRKNKFTPNPRAKRNPRPPPPPATNTEVGDDDELAQSLIRRMTKLGRREPQVERNSNVQVAFGPADSSSTLLRTYGSSKGASSANSSGSASKDFSNEQTALTSKEDQSDTTDASAWENKKEYKEPWDYNRTYYPITLPLRRPYSGDPEILDQEEFGAAAAGVEYDENALNSAAELKLLENSEKEKKFILFQFPPTLPLVKQQVSRKGKEKVGKTPTASSGETTKLCSLAELPGGYMGKMLVYKSGAVKLKLGETLFDVSPGTNSSLAQDVAAMNIKEEHCCVLGELGKKAVVTPVLDGSVL